MNTPNQTISSSTCYLSNFPLRFSPLVSPILGLSFRSHQDVSLVVLYSSGWVPQRGWGSRVAKAHTVVLLGVGSA